AQNQTPPNSNKSLIFLMSVMRTSARGSSPVSARPALDRAGRRGWLDRPALALDLQSLELEESGPQGLALVGRGVGREWQRATREAVALEVDPRRPERGERIDEQRIVAFAGVRGGGRGERLAGPRREGAGPGAAR